MPDIITFLKKTKVFLDDICSEIYAGDMSFEYIEDSDIRGSLVAEYTDENNAVVYINPALKGRERDVALMIGAARVWQMRHNFPLLKVKSEFENDGAAQSLCSMLNEYVHSNHARYIVRSNRLLYTNGYAKSDIKMIEESIEDILCDLSRGRELSHFEIALFVVRLCYLYEMADEAKADVFVKNKYILQTDIAEFYRRGIITIGHHDCSYKSGCIRFFEAMLFVLNMEDVFEIGCFKRQSRAV